MQPGLKLIPQSSMRWKMQYKDIYGSLSQPNDSNSEVGNWEIYNSSCDYSSFIVQRISG